MTSIILSIALIMLCCQLSRETVSVLYKKIDKLSEPAQIIACYSIGGFYGFVFGMIILLWVL